MGLLTPGHGAWCLGPRVKGSVGMDHDSRLTRPCVRYQGVMDPLSRWHGAAVLSRTTSLLPPGAMYPGVTWSRGRPDTRVTCSVVICLCNAWETNRFSLRDVVKGIYHDSTN